MALILHAAHVDIDVSGQLTAGDVLVGAGTLLLAVFTWRLAVFTSGLAQQTLDLDLRNAARERKRRERQVRGIARLVDGELTIVARSIGEALDTGQWWFYLPTPRGAWDRDGALIAETVAQDEALDLIRAFSKLASWLAIVALGKDLTVGEDSISVADSGKKESLWDLAASITQAQRHLAVLAYPDARDLEPDPDAQPPGQRSRRRWWRFSGSPGIDVVTVRAGLWPEQGFAGLRKFSEVARWFGTRRRPPVQAAGCSTVNSL